MQEYAHCTHAKTLPNFGVCYWQDCFVNHFVTVVYMAVVSMNIMKKLSHCSVYIYKSTRIYKNFRANVLTLKAFSKVKNLQA